MQTSSFIAPTASRVDRRRPLLKRCRWDTSTGLQTRPRPGAGLDLGFPASLHPGPAPEEIRWPDAGRLPVNSFGHLTSGSHHRQHHGTTSKITGRAGRLPGWLGRHPSRSTQNPPEVRLPRFFPGTRASPFGSHGSPRQLGVARTRINRTYSLDQMPWSSWESAKTWCVRCAIGA